VGLAPGGFSAAFPPKKGFDKIVPRNFDKHRKYIKSIYACTYHYYSIDILVVKKR